MLGKRFNRGASSHRHKDRGLNISVGGDDLPRPGLAVLGREGEVKRFILHVEFP